MRTDQQPPTVLAGRYALEMELGTSGTGTSWSSTDTVLDRRVVVKLISPELAREPAFAERLDLELRMVALASHRGLARLLDTGKDDGIAFIVREHVEGDSARTMITRDGNVPVEQGAGLVRGALDAIAAAHEAGTLLHGDVPIASDHGPGAVALDVLSDDERDAVVLPSVEEAGQAPMRRQGHHPELQVESFGERGLAGELRADQLHDHAAVKDRVGGAPGGARPARAQLHLKGVPAGEHGGWLLIGPHPLSLRPCLRQNGREASDRRGPQTVEGPEVSLAFALTRESREAIRPAIRVEALFTTTTVALPVRGSMEKPSLAGIRDPGASCFTDSTAAL